MLTDTLARIRNEDSTDTGPGLVDLKERRRGGLVKEGWWWSCRC